MSSELKSGLKGTFFVPGTSTWRFFQMFNRSSETFMRRKHASKNRKLLNLIGESVYTSFCHILDSLLHLLNGWDSHFDGIRVQNSIRLSLSIICPHSLMAWVVSLLILFLLWLYSQPYYWILFTLNSTTWQVMFVEFSHPIPITVTFLQGRTRLSHRPSLCNLRIYFKVTMWK